MQTILSEITFIKGKEVLSEQLPPNLMLSICLKLQMMNTYSFFVFF